MTRHATCQLFFHDITAASFWIPANRYTEHWKAITVHINILRTGEFQYISHWRLQNQVKLELQRDSTQQQNTNN